MADKIDDALQELQDEISEAITDSLDVDWSASDGARAVMRIPAIAEVPAMVEALRELLKALAGYGEECPIEHSDLFIKTRAILARIEGVPSHA